MNSTRQTVRTARQARKSNARSSIIPTVHNDDEVFGRHSASQGIFVTEMDNDKLLRIPAPLRHHVEQLFKFTDPFCGEHLDAEYAELIRKLIAKLARKRPSPLVRGDLRIWAAAAISAVGSVNFLFGRAQRPHLTGDDLSALTGVPKSTIANKARLIRDVLRIGRLTPEFCRRELLASNPMSWMISVGGIIVDVLRDAARGPSGGMAPWSDS